MQQGTEVEGLRTESTGTVRNTSQKGLDRVDRRYHDVDKALLDQQRYRDDDHLRICVSYWLRADRSGSAYIFDRRSASDEAVWELGEENAGRNQWKSRREIKTVVA